jgi:hypothetical protein
MWLDSNSVFLWDWVQIRLNFNGFIFDVGLLPAI